MADHIRLFSRPLVMDDVAAALSITGVLPEYSPGDAFEGRLQINNPIGRCRVELMPDSVLPPAVTVRVDNITREIVLKWAAYRIVDPVESSPVLNGDFEAGDDGSWTNENEGWSIVDGRGIGGGKAAQFQKGRGVNNYIGTLVPVTDINKIIKLEASINHGSSGTGELVAGPYILWYDINRNIVRWTNPNTYVRGGANGDWHDYSFAEGSAADPNIKFVAPGLSANRKSNKHALWVDNVRWNHAYTVGQNRFDDYWVHLKVTDSANRVAYWSGFLSYASSYITSVPYAIDGGAESLVTGYAMSDLLFYEGVKTGASDVDSGIAYALGGFTFQTNELDAQEESGGIVYALGGFVFRDTTIPVTEVVPADTTYTLGGFSFREIPQGLGISPAATTYTLGGFTFQ